MDLQERISIDPKVCHGKPCIKGTRIMVSNILAAVSEGLSTQEIFENFPGIAKEDILACVAFANDLVEEKLWLSTPQVEPA